MTPPAFPERPADRAGRSHLSRADRILIAWIGQPCRQALLAGATFHLFEHNPVPVDDLAAIYEVREEITREAGVFTLGFSAAVQRLQTSDLDKVWIGSVKDRDHRLNFVFFVATDGSQIVSCLGISQRPR